MKKLEFLRTFLWMAQPPSLCRYHTLFASCALEIRSWKESRHHRPGGLGHVGVKIAHALAAEVTVLSH